MKLCLCLFCCRSSLSRKLNFIRSKLLRSRSSEFSNRFLLLFIYIYILAVATGEHFIYGSITSDFLGSSLFFQCWIFLINELLFPEFFKMVPRTLKVSHKYLKFFMEMSPKWHNSTYYTMHIYYTKSATFIKLLWRGRACFICIYFGSQKMLIAVDDFSPILRISTWKKSTFTVIFMNFSNRCLWSPVNIRLKDESTILIQF